MPSLPIVGRSPPPKVLFSHARVPQYKPYSCVRRNKKKNTKKNRFTLQLHVNNWQPIAHHETLMVYVKTFLFVEISQSINHNFK